MDIFDAGDEKGGIEPRQWLLGTTFCRGYLSGLTSAGGSGKTTVRILQALSLACGRALSGEHVFVRSRVMIVCLEDDLKELRRRVLGGAVASLGVSGGSQRLAVPDDAAAVEDRGIGRTRQKDRDGRALPGAGQSGG